MSDSRVTCTDYSDTTTCSTTSGNISALHLLITVTILFITVFIFYLIVTVRRRHRDRHLRSLPQTSVSAVLPVGKRSKAGASVPKRVHQAIMNEFERSSSVLARLSPDPERFSDPSWGAPKSSLHGTHFETTLAKSYPILEEAARAYDPRFELGPRQSVRDYVEMLKRECVGIDAELCDVYLAFYEMAQFGNTVITERHYNQFCRSFFELLRFFQGEAMSSPFPNSGSEAGYSQQSSFESNHLLDERPPLAHSRSDRAVSVRERRSGRQPPTASSFLKRSLSTSAG